MEVFPKEPSCFFPDCHPAAREGFPALVLSPTALELQCTSVILCGLTGKMGSFPYRLSSLFPSHNIPCQFPGIHTHTRGLTLILTISLMSQKPQFCSFMYNRELKYCSPVCTFVTWCTAALSGQSTNLLVHCSAFSCCDSSSVNELSF